MDNLAISINITEDASQTKEKIVQLLHQIEPTWPADDIQIKSLSGGYVNSMWVCAYADHPKIVVRVYPRENINPFADKDREYAIMTFLAERNIIPKVHLRFQNGLIYNFAEGRTLTEAEMTDFDIMKKILNLVHRIHSAPWHVGSLYDSDRYKNLLLINDLPESFTDTKIQQWCSDNFPSRSILLEELSLCKELISQLFTSYPAVLCHHDLWNNNIIYNTETDAIVFIDWEQAGLSVAPLEFAVLFENWMGESSSPEYKKNCIKIYLAVSGNDDSVERWYRDCIKACVICQLGCLLQTFHILHNAASSVGGNLPGLLDFGVMSFTKYSCYKKILQSLQSENQPDN